MSVKLTREDLNWAASQGIVSAEQAETLWKALQSRSPNQPRFDAAHVLYYFGAMIIIAAMSFFMTLGWEQFGGAWICIVSCVYAAIFTAVGLKLLGRGLRVPGGLLVTVAVCVTPLAIYGLERWTGFWTDSDPGHYRDYHVWVNGSWILMELGTILAALLALRSVKFPFLTAPIAFSLWYLSMDLTPLIYGQQAFSWEHRQWVSLWFGLAMLVVSYVVDRRTKDDYSFWLYLFGLTIFWGAMSSMDSGSQLNRFLYCLVNLGLMLLSVVLDRRVFIVFGSMGVFGYLGYLSWDVFKDSLLFPFALTALGLVLIALGIWYQRNQDRLRRSVVGIIPARLLWLLPSERAGA
jgi:hypothetical protein